MAITDKGIFVSDKKPENNFEEHKSFGHLLFELLTRPDRSNLVLFVDDASGREWTGLQLRNRIWNVASALIDSYNFKRGTCVCISYDHSDYTLILALAVIAAGGFVACAFPKDPYAELLYLAKKVNPKFLFCHQKNITWGKQLSDDLKQKVVTIAMDYAPEAPTSGDYFMNLFEYDYTKAASRYEVPVACEDVRKDITFIMMSSGTTGLPKAIPVTHYIAMNDAFNATQRSRLTYSFTASLDYVSGRLIMMVVIKAGYRGIILNSSEPKNMLRAIEKYKINIVFLGGAAYYNLITSKHLDDYDISSLAVSFPMGAKITYIKELRDFFSSHPNIKAVGRGYGTSESSGLAVDFVSVEEYLADVDNCGKLKWDSQAKIVDSTTGKPLGINQKGMLHIKNSTLFPGYYDVSRVSDSTCQNGDCHTSPLIRDSSIFDEDGFYITGDIAYFNEKEELFIVGRQKEMLHCRFAKKVLPGELETLIMKHPAVSKVCVLGIPNKTELTLHCPRAYIVPKHVCYETGEQLPLSQSNPTCPKEPLEYKGMHRLCKLSDEARHKLSEDIMEFVNDRIGWEKQLTGGIVLIDDIPTSRSTGKMNKNYLKSLTLDQIEIYGDRSE